MLRMLLNIYKRLKADCTQATTIFNLYVSVSIYDVLLNARVAINSKIHTIRMNYKFNETPTGTVVLVRNHHMCVWAQTTDSPGKYPSRELNDGIYNEEKRKRDSERGHKPREGIAGENHLIPSLSH